MKTSHEMVSAVMINSWIGFKNPGEKWTVYNNNFLPYHPAFLILSNPCCSIQVIKKLYVKSPKESNVVEKIRVWKSDTKILLAHSLETNTCFGLTCWICMNIHNQPLSLLWKGICYKIIAPGGSNLKMIPTLSNLLS